MAVQVSPKFHQQMDSIFGESQEGHGLMTCFRRMRKVRMVRMVIFDPVEQMVSMEVG